MVYATRRFILSLALYYFVLVFFSPWSNGVTSLGEERAHRGAFRAFVRFALVWFRLFSFPFRLSSFSLDFISHQPSARRN